jgi:fructose-1,6-bisphosphatase I
METESGSEQYGIQTDCLTLSRFLLAEQKAHPHATGDFTNLINSLLTAIKSISAAVRKAGLAQLFGIAGATNVQGEEVKKLDVLSNELMINMLRSSFNTAVLISEENENIVEVDVDHQGKYVVAFDPLDGSSNIDCLISIGTIFSVWRKVSKGKGYTNEDILQPGRKLVAAGYALYGSATMVVLSTGRGVNGYTLDPQIGEFLLTHRDIRIKPKGKIFSVNESHYKYWSKGLQEYIRKKKAIGEDRAPMGARYVGSMVADVHRTLLYGGIFMYPENSLSPKGKLRLLYEAAPMAYIIEQAGGTASNGQIPILDIQPEKIHERAPTYLGSTEDVTECICIMNNFNGK